MHLRETAEIAAIISANSVRLIESQVAIPAEALNAFWLHSKDRLALWTKRLHHYNLELETTPAARHAAIRKQAGPLLADIFAAEILLRVWTAVLTANDRHRQVCFAEPIVRNALLGQMQARQLAFDLMVRWPNAELDTLAPIDSIRRRSDRWTDLLLGHIVTQYEIENVAIDDDRAREFGIDQLSQGIQDPRNMAWNLILAGLRLAFPAESQFLATSPDHQQAIVQTVLTALPRELADVEGPCRQLLRDRLQRIGTVSPRTIDDVASIPPADLSSITPLPKPVSFASARRQQRPES